MKTYFYMCWISVPGSVHNICELRRWLFLTCCQSKLFYHLLFPPIIFHDSLLRFHGFLEEKGQSAYIAWASFCQQCAKTLRVTAYFTLKRKMKFKCGKLRPRSVPIIHVSIPFSRTFCCCCEDL